MSTKDEAPPRGPSATDFVIDEGTPLPAGTATAEDVDAQCEALLDRIFEFNHVSPADLRAVYEHLRNYVQRLQTRLRDEVSDSVFTRCLEAIEDLRSEKTADIESAVQRIRALFQATSTRVSLLEASKDNRRDAPDSDARRAPPTRPTPAQSEALRGLAMEFETLEARLRSLEPPFDAGFTDESADRERKQDRRDGSRCTDCRKPDQERGPDSPHTPPRSPLRMGEDSDTRGHDGYRRNPREKSQDYRESRDRRNDDVRKPRDFREDEGLRGHRDFERRDFEPRQYPRNDGAGYLSSRPPPPAFDRGGRAPYGLPDAGGYDYDGPDFDPRFDKSPRRPPFMRSHYPQNPLHPAGAHGYPAGGALAGSNPTWGPPHPGIPENTTLIEPFQAVISYRSYRLNDVTPGPVPFGLLAKVGKYAAAVKGLVRETLCYDGREPIRLLAFFTDVKRGFDGTGISEGLGVHVLQYFLEGDAARFYRTVTTTAIRSMYSEPDVAWPLLVHQFIRRYCPDTVLGDAYNRVTRMTQSDDEDELQYADRIQDAAMDCPGVFTESMLINYFVRGLPSTTQETVAEQVARLPIENRADFFAVRKVAHAEGATYRARARAMAAQATPSKNTSKPAPVLLLGREIPEGLEGPSPPLSRASSYLRPEEFDVLYKRGPLESSNNVPYPILITQEDGDANAGTPEVIDEIDVTSRVEKALPRPIPRLTDYELRCAEAMIPAKDSWYVCWACRDTGHSLYRCPFLNRRQQLYFAMCNYKYQREAYPMSRNLLDQKVRDTNAYAGRRGEHRGEDRRNRDTRDYRDYRNRGNRDARDRRYRDDYGGPKEILRRGNGGRSEGRHREETDEERRDRFSAAVLTMQELAQHPAVAEYAKYPRGHRDPQAHDQRNVVDDADSDDSSSIASGKE